MADGKEPILSSALRTFLKTVFAMIGLAVGLIPFFMIIGLASSGSGSTVIVEPSNKVSVLYGPEGKREPLQANSPLVLQVNIEGVIGMGSLTGDKVLSQLYESREGDLKEGRVKALLLYINSPGGTVVDADAIYRYVKGYKEKFKVPVIAYVDGLCASGGYYVAAAADKIYASDVSIVGSVGVILPTFMNFSKVIDKLGIDAMTISAGKGKDELNPFRTWSPDEAKGLQAIADHDYQRFVQIVTENRPTLSREKLVSEYGAGIFSSPEAEKRGYIDGVISDYSTVLKDLATAAGLEEGSYQVVTLEQKSWINDFLNNQSALFKGKIEHYLMIPGQVDPALSNQVLYLYQPTE